MATRGRRSELDLDHEYDLQVLRSHERHMRHIYGLRWAALGISTITIIIGAVMIFEGLQGSFNWAIEAPNSVGAKLTNASPGIVFATVGLILGFVVVIQKPVNYNVGAGSGMGGLGAPPKRKPSETIQSLEAEPRSRSHRSVRISLGQPPDE